MPDIPHPWDSRLVAVLIAFGFACVVAGVGAWLAEVGSHYPPAEPYRPKR